jgi:uncharacterized SAM-binding protein YcdF (DUF218 family)
MKRSLIPYLMAFLLPVCSCTTPIKSYREALPYSPYDVIIVPGIPYHDQDWASNVMKSRVIWACFLYSRGIGRNLIFSGNANYSPYVEGKIMALHAIALGVPRDHVFSETKAEHSTENLVYSFWMAQKMGFKKIALATDPFQSNTLKTYAWDLGLRVTFIPVIYDSTGTYAVDPSFHVDPSSAFVKDFIPLSKRNNPLKRVLGTMGLEISTFEPEITQ